MWFHLLQAKPLPCLPCLPKFPWSPTASPISLYRPALPSDSEPWGMDFVALTAPRLTEQGRRGDPATTTTSSSRLLKDGGALSTPQIRGKRWARSDALVKVDKKYKVIL